MCICFTELEEVVSVYPSHPEKYSLQTTRSWEFVGLDEVEKPNWNHFRMRQDLLSKARYGQDVIVGLVDSGKTKIKLSLHSIFCFSCDSISYGFCSFSSTYANKRLLLRFLCTSS